MVVLIIKVNNFAFRLIDAERYPPVPRNAQTPCSLAVSRELVDFPAWNVAQLLRVLHFLQERNDVAYLLDHGRRQAGTVIALNKAP